MSKIRIYIESCRFDETVYVGESEIIHKAKDVLRLKRNDEVYLFDGQGQECQYVVETIDSTQMIIKKNASIEHQKKISPCIILAFPLVKEEKTDFILQKATELGVSVFLPFACQRSINILPSSLKYKRWQKIIVEASRQSQQLWVPRLLPVASFNDMVRYESDMKCAAAITGTSVAAITQHDFQSILIAVGPEGDFSPGEYRLLEQNIFHRIVLSPHVLRVETASVFAVGLLRYWFSDKACFTRGLKENK